MCKKIVILVFSFVVLFLFVPTKVSAGEIASGTCGGNLEWTLNDEGVLTISGKGDMPKMNLFDNSIPWKNLKSNIVTVVIGEGVTSIGDFAFSGCQNMTAVQIPKGVTYVGQYAFDNCRSLTAINIPEGVATIGNYVFMGCSGLTAVDIPDGVVSIGKSVFQDCRGLTSVRIPVGVTSIGECLFKSCSKLSTVNIPDGVLAIGRYAFSGCSSLTSINIPDSVTAIGEAAFNGCALKEITIPGKVVTIGNYAFVDCDSLTTISIPDSVTNIGVFAFSSCSNLLSVNIPGSIKKIGQGLFADCGRLATVNISDGVTTIGKWAFQACGDLTTINIPNSVTSIGEAAFISCSSLTTVNIPDSVIDIGASAFSACVNLITVNIPESITQIEEYTFSDCYRLSSVNISDSVTTIDDHAFSGCMRLITVNISDNLTAIGEYAFAYCYKLNTIDIPVGVTTIGKHAFSGCYSMTKIVIPDSVTTMGESAFAGCNAIKKIVFCGDLPVVESDNSEAEVFRDVGATAYYPALGNTMSQDIKDTYGRLITWVEYQEGEKPWEEFAVTEIVLNKTAIFLDVAEQYVLTASVLPENATDRSVQWSSYNERIAKVDENGNVIALSGGTTTILASALDGSGVTASCIITVKVPIVFEDVNEDAYYAQAVQWAIKNDITNGYGSVTTFCPDLTCTRGQVVTFLWRAKGCPEPTSTVNPFTDIKESDYYYKAVLWAVENGITSGYGSSTIFNPDGACTRGQVATFLWRAEGQPSMSGAANPFTDVAPGTYYYDAVLWAVANGVTNGYGGSTTFAPDEICNRGQIVTFLYRAEM